MYRNNRQFDGAVIDWLPGEDESVIMSRVYQPEAYRGDTRTVDRDEGLGVVTINTNNGDLDRIEPPVARNVRFLTDGHGTVRMKATGSTCGSTGKAGSSYYYYYRLQGKRNWRDFGTYDGLDQSGFYPLAIDRDLNAVYGFERLDGRDALYRITLNETLDRKLIFAHPTVDVSRLARLGRHRRVIGVGYSEDRSMVEYFDPEYAALHQALGNALPGNSSSDRRWYDAPRLSDAAARWCRDRTARDCDAAWRPGIAILSRL